MSIATLKKKTNQKYNSMSVGRTGFSIIGTHRSQGFVGQNLISRSLPSSKMHGSTTRGHGGNNGNYHTPPNIVSGINYQNDPKFIKSSVVGTSGMIATKYRWIHRGQPFATVKSNSTNHNNNQSDLISRKKLSANIDPISNNGGILSILPLPFTNSTFGLCNFSGNGTQNGVYKSSQSSGNGYNAFNGSITGWITDTNYDLNGAYAGNAGINVQNYGFIPGEWLQLQIPSTLGQLFTLTNYSISPIVSEFNTGGNYDLNFDSSPSAWYVLGSMDGSTWFVVDHQSVGIYHEGSTFWSSQHLQGIHITPLTFSINNTSVGYVFYSIIFTNNGASTYQNSNTFNNTYVGVQNITFKGTVKKGINQGCSGVKKNGVDSKFNKMAQYNVTKNALTTVNQSTYINTLQRVCISTEVSDLQIKKCTPGF